MELLISLIVEAVFGIVGGTIVTSLKSAAMPNWPKYLAGIVGGIIGGMILVTMIASGPGGVLDFTSFIGQIVGGVIGGGVATAIVAVVMKPGTNE